jgi:hypothetical protein
MVTVQSSDPQRRHRLFAFVVPVDAARRSDLSVGGRLQQLGLYSGSDPLWNLIGSISSYGRHDECLPAALLPLASGPYNFIASGIVNNPTYVFSLVESTGPAPVPEPAA